MVLSILVGTRLVREASLSYFLDENTGEFYLASVTGSQPNFIDCTAGIIYQYSTRSKKLNSDLSISSPYEIATTMDQQLTKLPNCIDGLFEHLNKAVHRRIVSIHPAHIENSPISILFSGGLDCSVIAALICKQLSNIKKEKKPILELLNVGFENPRTGMLPKDVPDRKLALSSSEILKNLYPDVTIKLVNIDVSYEEYLEYRPKVIDLMFPKQTEMDLSIAISFFFAAKGSGYTISKDGIKEKYQRKGIVLFSGLGADELYGGYHKFANKSPDDLAIELTRQINNIYDRNLNRDDKVIANNGVEVRYPFLDEEVIKFSTMEIPINYKVNKMILRKIASEKLNLATISDEPKRAIQFGAKSAKMTKDGNKHGTDILTS